MTISYKILFVGVLLISDIAFAGFYKRDIPNEKLFPYDTAVVKKKYIALGVGQVQPSGCTATQISNTLILVATHCIYDSKKAAYDSLDTLQFMTSLDGYTSYYVNVEQILPKNLPRKPPLKKSDFATINENHLTDVTLLRIARGKLPSKVKHSIGIDRNSLTTETKFFVSGFITIKAPNMPPILGMEDLCRQSELFHENIYYNNCSSADRTSGAAMFVSSPEKKLAIAGIMIGTSVKNTALDRVVYSVPRAATYSHMFFLDDPYVSYINKLIQEDF